jgi:AcrR family transcriptional regulator
MSRKERRKEQRPEEIVEAAMEEFAARGYAGTRLDDVAARAGISKGLVYVYFRTKEELFKAVIRTFLVPRVESLRVQIEASEETSEALIRGPLLELMKQVVRSRLSQVVRLLIAEGPKHPDLTAYYHDQVVRRGISVLRSIIDRGIERGEFRPAAVKDFPQLVVAPVLMALVWKLLMERHQHLDAESMLDAHIEMLLCALKGEGRPAASSIPAEEVRT